MPFTALRDFHLYFYQAPALFKARTNMPGTITYPVTELTYDGVTLGDFNDVVADLTLLLGTTDGADDLGRTRVQNIATSTTIPVGRVSQGIEDGTLNIQDNAYITILLEFRVYAKIPYIDPSGNTFKDANVSVSDYTENPPPQANMGTGFADYIDPDTNVITVSFDASDSYAVADGATIASVAWNIEDGTYTVGSSSTTAITATFPAGVRYVSLTVTDSNAKSHSTRRLVLAVDPEDDPTIKFQVESHRIEMRGQTIGFRILDDMPRSSVRDGSQCIFWADAPIDPTDRSHVLFYGFHQSDTFSIRATPTGLVRDTILNCVDVAGRLATLPGFPQALERSDEEGWEFMPTLDMRKCLHYLAFWHSTALSLADFFLPDDLADYPAMRLDSTGASLYDQINSRAQSCVPDHWLTCNIQGQLNVLPDWMLLDEDDRPVDTAGTFTEDFWQSINADYNRPPKIYVLNSAAVVCSTEWLMLGGEETLPLAFCKAPGTAFGQGVSEATTNEKLTQSQEQLNSCEGHRKARLDARYGLFSIVEPTGDIQDFQPAHMLPVQVNISAATAAQRGLDFTTARGLVKSIDMRYTHTEFGTWVQPTVQWEREVTGLPAVTHIPEQSENPPDYETPEPPPSTVPPDFGLTPGQELVAGIGTDGYLYRTFDFQTPSGSGGPTWERIDLGIPATRYSWVVDPFSPGYINGTGTINGWVANDDGIYRVTDAFGSAAATSVYTFDEPTVGASFHWRSIQASFGAFFPENNPWLVCVSYYGDTVGHTGTWATRSLDGGVTWSAEVQISAHYNETTPVRFNPIGVYCSPKTPGLAYTAAYSETAENAQAVGYVSSNWGASWSAYSAIDPGTGNAGSIHLPWPDNASEDIFYHGELITAITPGTAEPLLPHWGITLDGALDSIVESPVITHTTDVSATDTGASPITPGNYRLLMAPPADAKRVVVDVTWQALRTRTSASFSGADIDHTRNDGSQTLSIDTFNYVLPAYGVNASGAYQLEWNSGAGGADWTRNRDDLDTYTGSADYVNYCRLQLQVFANSIQPTATATATITVQATISEIELDDTTVYVPTLPSGSRGYRLKRIIGGVVQDISPIDSDIAFGINDLGFVIRAWDGDRQIMVLAGIGNDTSDDVADDLVGLWTSINAGGTWSNILAPVAASNAPRGLQLAISGLDENTIFSWGGLSSGSLAGIYYSIDFGSTLDSRQGNLESSFGDVVFIGIAGGTS